MPEIPIREAAFAALHQALADGGIFIGGKQMQVERNRPADVAPDERPLLVITDGDHGASLGELIWNGPITRYQDTMTQPTLSTSRPWLDIDACCVGEPQTCLQTFTEAEMWGTDPNGANAAAPWGGNASNHETSIALTALMAPAFASTNLSA